MPLPAVQGCDGEWPELDKMAARQVEDPALRFGGENDAAEVDPTVNTQVLASDPIAGADFGLRNIDRVAPMLISATTKRGRDYSQLAEVYQALISKRYKQLSAVAKMVGGVEETRYHAGRGTIPFKPVAASRQRAAVAFIVERGFARPDALLDPDVLWRIGPSDGTELLQTTNERLLNQLIDSGVIHRMAQAGRYPGMKGTYQGIDLIKDLNNGLFAELKQPRPVIGLYRRDLQRKYVSILLSQLSADDDSAGEMQAAIRAGISDLGTKLNQVSSKIRDPQTQWHLQNLKAILDRGG